MDEHLRHQICRLVAGIVVTDDDLDPREDQFIDRLLESFGIPTTDRGLIFPIVDAEDAAIAIRALPPDAKEEALHLLLEASLADGKIVDEERHYLEVVADAMGMTEAETNRMIRARLSAN